MAKTNVTHKLQPWNQYQGVEPDTALDRIYRHATETADQLSAWYWHSIGAKRQASVWLRVLVFALLAGGTMLPVYSGMKELPLDRLRCTQLGVVMLAAAGLLQLCDRAFGFSTGWMRYVSTATAIEARIHQFQLEWAGIMSDKGMPLQAADVRQFFDLAKLFEDDIIKMQGEETEKWVSDFNGGIAVLDGAIKNQRDAADQAVERARATVAAARQTGSIELTLKHSGAVAPVRIALDGEDAGAPFLGTSWSRLEVPVGQHKLSIATSATPPLLMEKIVEVAANAKSALEVTLP